MFAQRVGAFLLDIIQVLVFAVSIFLFIYLLVAQPHKIKGSSMEPDFHDGEFLLTDKVTYRLREPRHGDVIVFKAPPDDQDEYIKRIMGIPGDKVMVQNGRVWLNGVELTEDYIAKGAYTSAGNFALEGKEFTVPDHEYFVMGDNREHSFDGRNFGLIDKSKITGRAWLVYWPIPNFGVVKEIVF